MNLLRQAFKENEKMKNDYDWQIAKLTAYRDRLGRKFSVKKQDSEDYFGTGKKASNANLPNLNHLVMRSP